MRKVFVAAVILSVLQGCAVSRGLNVEKMIKNPEPETLSMSAGFKSLWSDLKAGLSAGSSLSDFVPDGQFIEKHSLSCGENSYTVDGYVTVDAQKFTPSALKKHNVSLIEMNKKEGIYTFSCELKNLPYLIYADGVKYIETSKNVNLLKSNK